MDIHDSEIEVAKREFSKYAVQPFSKSIDTSCEDCIVHYFEMNGSMRHYFTNFTGDEYLSKTNPGNGQYGYKKEFKYWRDYYMVD